MNEENDDVLQLSAETFAALQQFYKEQEEKEMKSAATAIIPESDAYLDEDWQLSQFWYDDKTVDTLVKVALKSTGESAKIALISCPTLYKKLKAKLNDVAEVTLFEYDKRFALYGSDFIHYDYKSPLSIPRDKSGYYDLVIADPPFLSDECLTKVAVTIRFLAKNKMILCTGTVMGELADKLLSLKKTPFEPKHRNNLANEFYCYSNYNIDQFL